MKKLLYLCLITFSISAYCQNSIDREFLLDSLKNPASEKNYVYRRIVRNYYTEQNEYQFSDYYKSGVEQMRAKSTSKDGYGLKGIAVIYYENGQNKEQVYYQSGVKLGNYISWYENGQLKLQGEFLKNIENERQVGNLKINQFWNAEGIQKVTDGLGYFKGDESENVSIEGKIKDGLKDSIWSGKDKKLKCTFSEDYKNGRLIFGISKDSLGNSHNYKILEISPEYPGGVEAFYKYIARNFIPPIDVDLVSGKVFYTFVINEEGKTENIKIIKGIHPKIDPIGKRLIENSLLWRPGYKRGIVCKTTYSLPITIGDNR